MHSIFARPDSPPPRAPSPDYIPAALPSPPSRSRSVSRTPRREPRALPLSSLPTIDRSLFAARSCGNLRELARWDSPGGPITKQISRPTLEVSPPSTPRSLPLPSPTRSTYSSRSRTRRTLSNAVPFRSPPPSPSIEPPPPVPRVPALLLTPTDKKPVLRSQQARLSPIYLPELDLLSSVESAPPSLSRKHPRSSAAPKETKGLGMTCLKFFSIRNSHMRPSQTVAV